MTKFFIQYEDQHHYWRQWGTVHHPQQAVRTAKHQARNTKRRWRVVNEDGALLDLFSP